MDKSLAKQQRLLEEIRALVAKTTLAEMIKKEVFGCLSTASVAKLINLKLSLLIRLLIESQKETIDKFKKEKRSLTTMDDLNQMAKEAFSLVQAKEDQAISHAEATVIGKGLKKRRK